MSLAPEKPIGEGEVLKAPRVIRTEEEKEVVEKVSLGTTPEPQTKSKGQLKTMIIGLGVVLIIAGIALAAYVASSEDDSVLIALGPAYIGVIVIIAALRGKVLRA